MPQTIRLEFAKSNTKVSKPKQPAAAAATSHPALMHPLTGRKYAPPLVHSLDTFSLLFSPTAPTTTTTYLPPCCFSLYLFSLFHYLCLSYLFKCIFKYTYIYVHTYIHMCIFFFNFFFFFFFSNPFHNPTRSPQFFNLLRHTGHVGQTVEMVRLEEIIVVKKRLERNFYLSFLRGMFRTFGLQFHLHLEKCFLSEWQNWRDKKLFPMIIDKV